MIKMSDLYWAAGFLEGEGCFIASRDHTRSKRRALRWSAVVDASQVNPEPVRRLYSLFGGHLYIVKASPIRQEHTNWRVNGNRAIGLMMTLWPLMSVHRRKQIEAAIAKWKLNTGPLVGENNCNSKLSESDIIKILESSESQTTLGLKFSVAQATISKIKRRETWGHVNRSVV